MLPIIDLNLNNMSCLFSTLTFVEHQVQLLSMPVACITFDQPLWQKATEIACSTSMNVICRLGGFVTLMNFLSAVGSVMAGSGLAEALKCCYGPISVTHVDWKGLLKSSLWTLHCRLSSACLADKDTSGTTRN